MLYNAIILSLFSGLAIFLGGLLASLNIFKSRWLRSEVRHTLVAMGAGALISAIAFVLVPDGIKDQSKISSIVTFALGGIVFMWLDKLFSKSKSRLSLLTAMLLDFIPEAIVLGVVLAAHDLRKAIFIAVIIALQNFPEGYSSFLEMEKTVSIGKRKLLWWFFLISLSGLLYVFIGVKVFVGHPQILAMLMTFCAGGILYLVFQDVAPQAKLEKHWAPPLGAVFGFLIGMAGYIFI
ncbi:MAG: divalent cation transporter [Candidatus Omnitrophica bacterium]|nr:divalent cation transporter [Candidatus Omnitrophota bacterium]